MAEQLNIYVREIRIDENAVKGEDAMPAVVLAQWKYPHPGGAELSSTLALDQLAQGEAVGPPSEYEALLFKERVDGRSQFRVAVATVFQLTDLQRFAVSRLVDAATGVAGPLSRLLKAASKAGDLLDVDQAEGEVIVGVGTLEIDPAAVMPDGTTRTIELRAPGEIVRTVRRRQRPGQRERLDSRTRRHTFLKEGQPNGYLKIELRP
jgi:hypothetical protein